MKSNSSGAQPAPRMMHLFLHPLNTGTHLGGWRHPDAHAGGLFDLDYFLSMTRAAEAAKFDAVFFADEPGYRPIAGRDAFAASDIGKLEPVTLLAALASATSRIGLIGTVSTSFNEPYNIARKFATLDHLSKGRAGWNAVTSTTDDEARNFNLDAHLDHAERYARAEECVDVVTALWDSWEDEAFLRDKQTGRYADPAKLHALGHRGRFFQVQGPLNLARPPQAHPVIVQAGGSEAGRALGARTADAIFTGYPALDIAQAFYADMKQRAASHGRPAADLKIMMSMQIIVAPTESEAHRKKALLDSLTPIELALSWLQLALGGFDLSGYDLDAKLPPIPPTQSGTSARLGVLELAEREGMTIRQLAHHAAATRGGSRSLTGAPEQVADELERYFREGAADGFVVSPAYLPGGLDDFIDLVLPVLRERRLFRPDYDAHTLRGHLGLARPANYFVEHPEKAVEPTLWRRNQALIRD